MHVAHVQASMSPEHGGPTRSLANYCQSQSQLGHRVSLWTLEGYHGTSPAIRLASPIENHVYPTTTPRHLGRSLALQSGLRRAETPDLFHLHGAWSLAMLYGANEARQRGCPYVVELMGMYESWCLRQKWLKKRIVRWWFQDRILRDAACLHVNSHKEADDLRAMGFRRPIGVVPVGVDVDSVTKAVSQLPDASPWPELRGRQFLLYFSRIHPKKGLDLLLRAWARFATSHPEMRLAIAGGGPQEYVNACKALTERLGISDTCLWTGHVDELQKSWLLSRCHCYVLPTHSENFGNTVAEALAHRTPVLTTTQTPWSDVSIHGCGWVVQDNLEEISRALSEALAIGNEARRVMAQNGRDLVESRYSLRSVTQEQLAIYQWIAGEGPRPECVQD